MTDRYIIIFVVVAIVISTNKIAPGYSPALN